MWRLSARRNPKLAKEPVSDFQAHGNCRDGQVKECRPNTAPRADEDLQHLQNQGVNGNVLVLDGIANRETGPCLV
jgi:hypothetical protein